VTLAYPMNDDQWNMLIQDVAESFNEVTISRGFQYYKQNRVQGLTMTAPQFVEASVQGNEEYHVEMNLDFFSTSHCDCSVDGTCKHMIAVLLEYAFEQGRPANMLVNARSIVATKAKAEHSSRASKNNVLQFRANKSVLQSRLTEQASHIPTMKVEQWHELFEQCINQLPQDIRSQQYVEQAFSLILQLKPKLTTDIEHIFMLNVHLFVLTKIIYKRIHPSEYYYANVGRSSDPTLTELLETVESYFANGVEIAVKPQNQSLLEMTLAYIREEMLKEPSEKRFYLDIYNSYWHYWMSPFANDDRPYIEELFQLEDAGSKLGSILSRFPWFMAQARMNFYMGQDEQAWKLLKEAKSVSTIPSDMSIYYLYYLSHHQQWPRLLNWLTALPPLFRSYRREYLHKFMDFWELLIIHLPEAEKSMWDTLIAMLPYSRPIYEEKLLQLGRWKQWMDYHLSSGSDPAEFRVSELQPLERNAPELLLPFYHQAVERYVMIKNRDGYKAAVKLLKRLAKLYKRLKQEDRWDQFVATFIVRYSRLRALQEELRKGKLIQ
jgi:hypothetical protein